ncbi:uncharacterized protein KY384_006957 [Bacidia gigantensis]|uniref:uncharacterized protein n=1 Tax=Bacidia gigantensis TaxID=2732470 RepID=UPI001D039555|nr:uncharacterized protein KY384_006957 [Bacidia gigantensis]KAG8528041.1 hypothetical protein KY384_006957 [Bacidia gigantensis]
MAMVNGSLNHATPKVSEDSLPRGHTPLAHSARKVINHSYSPYASSPSTDRFGQVGYKDSIEKARRAKAENELSLHEERMLREKEEEVKQRRMRLERIDAARRREEEQKRSGEELGAQLLETLKQQVTARMEAQFRDAVWAQAEKDQQAWYEEHKQLEQMKIKAAWRTELEPVVKAQLTLDNIAEVKEQLMTDLRLEVTSTLRDQFEHQIEAEVRQDLRTKLTVEVRGQIRDENTSAIIDTLRHELHDTVSEKLREELRPQVIDELREEQIRNQENEVSAPPVDDGPPQPDNNYSPPQSLQNNELSPQNDTETLRHPDLDEVAYPELMTDTPQSKASEDADFDNIANEPFGAISSDHTDENNADITRAGVVVQGEESSQEVFESAPSKANAASYGDEELRRAKTPRLDQNQHFDNGVLRLSHPASAEGQRDAIDADMKSKYVDLDEEEESDEESEEGSEREEVDTARQTSSKDHRFDPAVHDIKFSSSPAPPVPTSAIKRSLSGVNDADDLDPPSAKRPRNTNVAFSSKIRSNRTSDDGLVDESDLGSEEDGLGSEVEDAGEMEASESELGEMLGVEDDLDGQRPIYPRSDPTDTGYYLDDDDSEEDEEEDEEDEEEEDAGSGEQEYATAAPLIQYTNTQETAIALDSSDDEAEGDTTLVEEGGFIAVNKKQSVP